MRLRPDGPRLRGCGLPPHPIHAPQDPGPSGSVGSISISGTTWVSRCAGPAGWSVTRRPSLYVADDFVTTEYRRGTEHAEIRSGCAGITLALSVRTVKMRTLGKAALLLLPIAIVGIRLHSRVVRNPVDVTREVTRCLSVVRAAARRRDAPVNVHRDRMPPQQDSPPAAAPLLAQRGGTSRAETVAMSPCT